MSQASLFSQTLAPCDAEGSEGPAKLHKQAPFRAASMFVEHIMAMSAPHLHLEVHGSHILLQARNTHRWSVKSVALSMLWSAYIRALSFSHTEASSRSALPHRCSAISCEGIMRRTPCSLHATVPSYCTHHAPTRCTRVLSDLCCTMLLYMSGGKPAHVKVLRSFFEECASSGQACCVTRTA